MRRSILVLIAVLMIAGAVNASEIALDALYERPLVEKQDFEFLVDPERDIENNPDVYIFTLYLAPRSRQALKGYNFRYFMDGRLLAAKRYIDLPFVYKSNTGGLRRGDYKVTFELEDPQGKISTKSLAIWAN